MAADRRPQSSRLSVAAFGAAGVAVVCCAGLPLLAAALGGVSLATVLGIGAGAVALVASASLAAAFFRVRRRRSCQLKERASVD